MSHLSDKKIVDQVLEEITNEILRNDLWEKALQKSRRDEEKAKRIYVEYRVQAIKDEVVIAKKIAKEHSAAIIQRYISKAGSQSSAEENTQHSRSNNLRSKGYHKKKCFKCGRVVVLEVKPCPGCHCNSFIFCR